MENRIAIWTAAGALVAGLWTIYVSVTSPTPLAGAVLTFVYLTCPITLVRHYAVSFYLVILVNAATYGLVGMVVEAVRGHHQTPLISH